MPGLRIRTRGECAGGSGAAQQSRCDLSVDVNERAEAFRLRVARHCDRLVEYEQAEIGDILPYFDRQRTFLARHRSQKDRPELTVEQERVIELRLAMIPRLGDGLKLRRRLEQQVCLQLTRRRRLFCHVSVSLRGALHCQEAPVRRRSVCGIPSE